MNHRAELLRLLEADLDGEIGAEDRARLEAALREHPDLAVEAAELRRLRGVFRAVPAAVAPDGFTTAVLAATVGADATAHEARSGFRIVRAAPWIAGLAAAALLTVMLGPWTDDGGRFGLRETPTETAGAPEPEQWVRDGEALDRPRALERAPAGAASEPVPITDLADAREAGDKLRADAEERGGGAPSLDSAGRKRRSASGRALREELEEPTAQDDATPSPDPADAPAPSPITAPATTTAPAPPVPPGRAPQPGGIGGGRAKSRGAPAPEPVKPTAPVAEAAESRSAADSDDVPALGGRAESMDLLREVAESEPAARRYVVFEDEAAARRFVASLRTLAKNSASNEKKTEADASGAADDGDRAGAKQAGPVADAESESARSSAAKDGAPDGPATGGGAGAGARAAFATGGAPRVLERVALVSSDPEVGRVFARAPDGGVFGESVPAGLLEAAEARFKLETRERQRPRPAAPGGEDVVADRAEPEGAAAPEKTAGATRRDGAEPLAGGKSKKPSARVEIVVVVVPKGTLPTRPAANEELR